MGILRSKVELAIVRSQIAAAAIRDLRAQNMLIWEAFKNEKESAIAVSPEGHQQLRDLGYL